MHFFGFLALIIFAVSIPLVALYAAGKFAGQRKIPHWAKTAVAFVVGCGLAFALFLVARAMGKDGWSVGEWITMAWLAGCSCAAEIGLLEMLQSENT